MGAHNSGDPNFSWAHAELAHVYLDEYRFQFNSLPNPLTRALDAAHRAVELDPYNALAVWRLAKVHFYQHELERFEAEAESALALAPHHAVVVADIGMHLVWMGKIDEGCALARTAMRLDPYYPRWLHLTFALQHYVSERYEEALKQSLLIDMPHSHIAPAWRAVIYAQLGMKAEARAEIESVFELRPDFDFVAHYERYNIIEPIFRRMLDGWHKAVQA